MPPGAEAWRLRMGAGWGAAEQQRHDQQLRGGSQLKAAARFDEVNHSAPLHEG
jgi:hypothetical protein